MLDRVAASVRHAGARPSMRKRGGAAGQGDPSAAGALTRAHSLLAADGNRRGGPAAAGDLPAIGRRLAGGGSGFGTSARSHAVKDLVIKNE